MQKSSVDCIIIRICENGKPKNISFTTPVILGHGNFVCSSYTLRLDRLKLQLLRFYEPFRQRLHRWIKKAPRRNLRSELCGVRPEGQERWGYANSDIYGLERDSVQVLSQLPPITAEHSSGDNPLAPVNFHNPSLNIRLADSWSGDSCETSR